jgi:DNA-binding LacI/PurR family transcriptional regulator
MARRKTPPHSTRRTTTLKSVAERVGLTTGTISAVLNDTPAARSIPLHTKQRILEAAKQLNYRPNYFARSLRNKRTYMIGVIAEEIGDAYGSVVISGIEECLRQENYFFLTVAHRHDQALLAHYSTILLERGVEGLITVDTTLSGSPPLPTVAVAGHRQLTNVTNIILDHERCALVALKHLADLGHRQIAFMKGHAASSDSEDRWTAICKVAPQLGLKIDPQLTIQIDILDSTYQLGYPFAKRLLARSKPFTALFAYNDISAIGAIHAIHEEGLRVPDDISVVGVDDIQGAAFSIPSLTTVRQPLRKMGQIAAQTVIAAIEGGKSRPPVITVEPELVVRKSTGPPRRI